MDKIREHALHNETVVLLGSIEHLSKAQNSKTLNPEVHTLVDHRSSVLSSLQIIKTGTRYELSDETCAQLLEIVEDALTWFPIDGDKFVPVPEEKLQQLHTAIQLSKLFAPKGEVGDTTKGLKYKPWD